MNGTREKALVEHYSKFDVADIIHIEKPDGRGVLIAVERDATGSPRCRIMGVAIETYFTEQRGVMGLA